MKRRDRRTITPKFPVSPSSYRKGQAQMLRRRVELAQPTILQTKEWRRAAPAQRRRGQRARAHAVNITTAAGPGGVGADPTHVVAYKIRAALRPRDAFRSPGPVRRIDPRTGQVLETLDPVTGRPL